MIRTLLTWMLPAALLLPSVGCAALPLSSLSSLSNLGTSSVTVGRDTYSFGKLHSAELAEFWSAEAAANMAAHDLGLHRAAPAELSEDGTQIDMAFVDDKGAQVGVRIEERSSKMLFLREDVGWLASFFGAEVTDRLFLLHLRQHLPPETKADTRPAAATLPSDFDDLALPAASMPADEAYHRRGHDKPLVP
jgi:hypothetical protein